MNALKTYLEGPMNGMLTVSSKECSANARETKLQCYSLRLTEELVLRMSTAWSSHLETLAVFTMLKA